ncbi:MAG: hypothetical protein LLG09_03620 [Negativicutes bacterium]|nr:hypothetical protein [Negativicutes bacterium]
MKTRLRFLLLLLCMVFLISGCTLQVRPVIPVEHGTIFNPNSDSQGTPGKESGAEQTPPAAEVPDTTISGKPGTEVDSEATKPLETSDKPSQAETAAARGETTESSDAEIADKAIGPADFSVKITPEQPDGDGEVQLMVTGPANTPYTATFHFRTRSSVLKGYCGSPFTVVLGGATAGYRVEVEVSALINGKLAKVVTSFTPK